jgi:AcrR family transcriptional regulator
MTSGAASAGPPTSDPTGDGTRGRLATAAFALFAEHGFAATTVDQITEAAGLGRRTFFRYFRSKEDVVFPDHDRLLAAVEADLETRRHQPPLQAVCDSVRLVLADYVRRREVSLHRFQLTREVPALREREVAGVQRYQRLFTRYLRATIPDLDAELMAAAVVTAHNHVLRHWLREGGRHDAFAELDTAFAAVQSLFATTSEDGSVVVAFRASAPLRDVVASIREATGG